MAAGLNQRGIQRLSRIKESLENTNKFLARLKVESIEELFRRDQVSVDSYASSHTGSSIVAFNRGASPELTPTERAAENNGFKKKRTDPVREESKRIERNIFKAEEHLRMAVESLTELNSTVEKKRGRQTTAPCEVCGILPITRRGFCDGCHDDWIANGSPDRQRWVAYQNALRNFEGHVLVTEQPSPRYAVQTLDIQE